MTGSTNVKVSKASAAEEALPDKVFSHQQATALSQYKLAATSRMQPTIGCRGLKQHDWFPWEGSEHGWLVWGVNFTRDLPSISIERML